MNIGITTLAGRRKLCEAHAGDRTLPAVAWMAWGDGGTDEDGTPKIPTGKETSLYHELLQKRIEKHEYVNDGHTTCRYEAVLAEGELTGKKISEMGLYDEEGDLISIRTFLEKGKDGDIVQIYDMDEIF